MGFPKLPNNCEGESDKVHESEKRRLQSLKEKKQAFKEKEKAVQNALKNTDNKSKNNKIIFDENIDEIAESKSQKRERLELFDSDGEESGNELNWSSKEFETKKKKSVIQVSGIDERFKLDDRFVEDDHDSTIEESKNENELSNLEKEKDQQLSVLESILGAPVKPKSKDTKMKDTAKPITKIGMIRYDPTVNGHEEYEIKTEKVESTTKKIKRKREEESETSLNKATPTVSKDIYFSVSESLTKSFAEKEQFSLLKVFGKEESKNKDDAPYSIEQNKPKKFQFSFDTKNPFQYDSSDAENEDPDEAKDKLKAEEESIGETCAKQKKNIFGTAELFFFSVNDPRFNEGIQFFSKEHISSEGFQSLRRELKEIVRSKIRKNVQKAQPWSNKIKIKKQS